MAMGIISGVSFVTIDGVPVAVDESCVKIDLAPINREPIVSKNGTVFIKESPAALKMSFTILVPGGLDVSQFNGKRRANIVVQLATGTIITAPNFANSGSSEYDSGEGKFATEWFGQSVSVTTGA